MKNIITILLVLLTVLGSAQTESEALIIKEINELRANPTSFIPAIERYIMFQEKDLERIKSGKTTIKSTSGTMTKSNGKSNTTTISDEELIERNINAANELIEELKNTKSLGKLTFNVKMDSITDSHGKFLESVNKHGHFGPNGQTLADRFECPATETVSSVSKYNLANNKFTPMLVRLLVDSGVENRGHRKALLNPKSENISIFLSDFVCVMNFI